MNYPNNDVKYFSLHKMHNSIEMHSGCTKYTGERAVICVL